MFVTGRLFSDGEVEVESGLGGRLGIRGDVLGGTGNAPILEVFLNVLPGGSSLGDAASSTALVRNVGTFGEV